MASTPNVYSSEPVFPVLADSLLLQSESTAKSAPPNETTTRSNWSLEQDWKQGIQVSKDALFRCGIVLGFSRLRMRSKESNEYIGQVLLTLILNILNETNGNIDSSTYSRKAFAEYPFII